MKTLMIMTALLAAPAAFAQEAASPRTCSTAMDTALPTAWAGWTQAEAITAGATPATQPQILIGKAYKAALSPVASTEYAVALKKTKEGSFGGLFMLTVDTAGIYTVGLDQPAWIDVVRDGKALKSTGHGHGPDCSTIHKTVDFQLEPGHYTVQISNADKDTVVLAVVAKPAG